MLVLVGICFFLKASHIFSSLFFGFFHHEILAMYRVKKNRNKNQIILSEALGYGLY
jgi:hypothetical protein